MSRCVILTAVVFAFVGCSRNAVPNKTVSAPAASASHSQVTTQPQVVDADFLVRNGFQRSTSDKEIFEIPNVRLSEIAGRLGFSLKDMRPVPPGQSQFSDIRVVKIRNLWFVVESNVKDAEGRVRPQSLDDPDAYCAISVSLFQVPPEKEFRKGDEPAATRP